MRLTKILTTIGLAAYLTTGALAANHPDWMEDIPGHIFVRDITIPGAHDAATKGIISEDLGKVQSLDINGLWEAGVRAFDLRPKYTNKSIVSSEKTLILYHGVSSTGVYLSDALQDISYKLEANSNDFAVIIIRDEDSSNHEEWAAEMKKMLEHYDNKIVKFTPSLTKDEAKGKMVILSRHHFDYDKAVFIDGWAHDPNGHTLSLGSGRLKLQDAFEKITPANKNAAFRKLLGEIDSNPSAWIINHTSGYEKVTTIAGNEISTGMGDFAKVTNADAVNAIKAKSGRAGIVMMDYAGDSGYSGDKLVEALINQNDWLKTSTPATSPYKGTSPEEAFAKGGKYYLYQVESGKWLQTNRHDNGGSSWTTHGELGGIGLDVELRRPAGENFQKGYQIYLNFTNNGELNGSDEDRFFFDQGDRKLTEWVFEPYGAGYRIKVDARYPNEGRSRVANVVYIGYDPTHNFGGLSDDPANITWQLVSREERIEKMKADAKANGSADATFLLPWNDRGRNDLRNREWEITTDGGNEGFDGSQYYPVAERWNGNSHRAAVTLTDLPNGTYSFAVQGFYRDGTSNLDAGATQTDVDNMYKRAAAGTSIHNARYFAGIATADMMTIFEGAKTSKGNGFEREVKLLNADGSVARTVYLPDGMGDAANAFKNATDVDVMDLSTPYMNNWISTGVENGTLTVGIEKTETEHLKGDWIVYKRMFLRYDGDQVKEENLDDLRAQLQALIDRANRMQGNKLLKDQTADAQNVHDNATTSGELVSKITEYSPIVSAIEASQSHIINFNATLDFHTDAAAQQQFDTAASQGEFEDALKTLRYARRRANADTHADVFEGSTPAANGKYYLYNIGQQQFLCGGSDWGTHAALGFPGTLLTLEDAGNGNFYIETGLHNGDNHHLSYRGYMDGPKDAFKFVAVSGKPGVYTVEQAKDDNNFCMAWDPYASTDRDNNDETTVGTEKDYDRTDANAQWKLISYDERYALIETATPSNPVDITFLIGKPNFNQKVSNEHWETDGFGIWGEGGNYHDFIIESFDKTTASITTTVNNLPDGVYLLSVQGFSRAGNTDYQSNHDAAQHSELFAGDESVLLPSILDESGNAPGEGVTANGYHIPNSAVESANFFKSGLYRTYLPLQLEPTAVNLMSTYAAKDYTNSLTFGVRKNNKVADSDWTVADNFRLLYYGNDADKEDVFTGIDDIATDEANEAKDSRIYNIFGVEVKNPTAPGIYISNGRKFIVR